MFINENNVLISKSIFSLLVFKVLCFLSEVFSQCPPGMEQDGTCNIKMFCFDPKETCTQGVCCQASKQGVIVPGPYGQPISQSPFCPMGAVPDGSCSYLKFCASPSEQCYMGTTCCKMANDPSMMGISAGGIGGISSQFMSNAGQMGGYGVPGMMGGGIGGYGGGMGGMNSYDGMQYNPYSSMMGGMVIPCHDTQPQCMMFMRYCALQSILEACMGTCGMCGMGMGGMGLSSYGGMGYGGMSSMVMPSYGYGMGSGISNLPSYGMGGMGMQGYGMGMPSYGSIASMGTPWMSGMYG